MHVKQYGPKNKDLWNNFIENSKNGVFLFNRNYMDYHSNRFEDFSLIFLKGEKIVAIIPANIKKDVLISHEGLTFGGIISNNKMSTVKMLEVFKIMKEFLKANGINKLVYKAIPHIYHTVPAEEDLYALFRNNARIIRRDVSSCIPISNRLNFTRQKRRNINRCKEKGLKVKRDYDFKTYMKIKEEDLIKNHGIKPVHSPEEMDLLANRFPDNIKLFTVKEDGEILSGIIIYESKNVAHGQYLAATERGKRFFVTDMISDFLINKYYKEKCYDCGISTENNGHYLNEGLILFKEGFKANAITYDFYEMDI